MYPAMLNYSHSHIYKMEQAGCTAVVVKVGQSSGTTVWAVFKTLGGVLMSTFLNLNSNSTTVNALVSSCVT